MFLSFPLKKKNKNLNSFYNFILFLSNRIPNSYCYCVYFLLAISFSFSSLSVCFEIGFQFDKKIYIFHFLFKSLQLLDNIKISFLKKTSICCYLWFVTIFFYSKIINTKEIISSSSSKLKLKYISFQIDQCEITIYLEIFIWSFKSRNSMFKILSLHS